MDMEVRGNRPGADEGVVFRATVREWAIVHEATRIVCEELLAGSRFETLRGPRSGGLADAGLCRQLAARLSRWMGRERFEGLDDMLVLVYVALRFREPPWPPSARPTHLLEGRHVRRLLEGWVSFLGHCGGFSVS